MTIEEKMFSDEILDALVDLDLGINVLKLPKKRFRHLNKEERDLLEPIVPGTNLKKVIKLNASKTITLMFFFDDSTNDITAIWVSKKRK